MNSVDFEKHSQKLIDHCWNTLFKKSAEYASDTDRLANFKQPCSMMGANPAQVALWYDMKHIGSMAKIAKDINDGKLPTKELLDEKVGDYINYGLLFYASCLELISNPHKK